MITRRGFLLAGAAGAQGPSLRIVPGVVNAVAIAHGNRRLAIYADPSGGAETVLLTHFRRDVCWAAAGARAVVAPAQEQALIGDPGAFWSAFERQRFHDYAMRNSKVLTEPLPVARTVRDGDRIDFEGLPIDVLGTPGYTSGAVSYLIETRGRRIACTGDLIAGDGQLLDLYSLQDAVPEAKLRGYHGYAARAGELIGSLRRVAERGPDILVPVRGPVIRRPRAAIDRLIERLKASVREHFKTDALRWYFGDDSLRLRSAKLLEGEVPEWMPMAETRILPDWALAIGNSRLLVSDTGSAFLIDCGYDAVIDKIKALQAGGRIRALEGVFITHYHDDHTDRAQACADQFRCSVYFTGELDEILRNPAAYRMPCLSPHPISAGKPQADGASMRWREFDLTFFYFPGQTLLHDALLVKRDGAESIFFLGDSFTPSGIDDYCLWNRNWLADGHGYLGCLQTLRRLPKDVWLANQHVEPLFRFSPEQFDYMEQSLRRRMAAMEELFPWPDINFGLDDNWARLAPYEFRAEPGRPFQLRAVVFNHARSAQQLIVRPHLPAGWTSDRNAYRLRLNSKSEGAASLAVTPSATPGRFVITADIDFAGMRLGRWVEAIAHVS
ncbi:MAG: MBL fold metallo-hydrolase [Bryobacteraceae bacterium]|nr:MBL fold metallo-hydrolase [Bryobacteraceae bacterium]